MMQTKGRPMAVFFHSYMSELGVLLPPWVEEIDAFQIWRGCSLQI